MYHKPKGFKDWAVLLTAWLTSVAATISLAYGIDLTQFIGPVVTIIILGAFLVVNLVAAWRNNKKPEQRKVKWK